MKYIIVIILFVFPIFTYAQKNKSLNVSFISPAPVIDGMLDENLQSLPIQKFEISESDKGSLQIPKALFRIACGTNFLYLYVEINSDSAVFRDRGYQNGDGMVVVIAKPVQNDEPSKEFYVMGFTAQREGTSNWQKKFIWYRNVDLSFARLQDAQFSSRTDNHKIKMECLIPWNEVYPYHPVLSESVGFNLAVVKGRGDNERIWYLLKEDNYIQNEQRPREYVRLEFNASKIPSAAETYAVLSRNNLKEGENLNIRFATVFSKEQNESFRCILFSGEHTRISSTIIEQKYNHADGIFEKEIICSSLPPGGYSLEWNSLSGSSKGTLYFTILPNVSIKELRDKLEIKKHTLGSGSYSTIMFLLQDLEAGFENLKSYETAYSQRNKLEEISGLIDSEKDLIAEKRGIFRRGFLSAVDNTYRPYSVGIPANLNKDKKYPLLVYLHGSGQDDRGILENIGDPGTEMLLLAPNGRGTSNAYTAENSQEDIEEAISDFLKYYPVDTSRIILAGFSMGGYGVYRTHYEHPSKYRALAVFSGGPSIGYQWMGENNPDFLEDKYLGPFAGKQMFIFHGSKDNNLPIENTRLIVKKLRDAGAEVIFAEEPVGHESPGTETMNKYREWLKKVLE